MNKGFETEAIARERAKADMPTRHVYIIESQGQFYVETDAPMIRNWEREIYSGIGKAAVPKKGYSTCRRCSAFVDYSKGYNCQRCGQDAGVAPVGVNL